MGVDAKGLYDLKLHIIERNLYGVDIDDFAVNIAMLRLWLSLAIDYEGDRPEPLPNLDFKILCGDSLLGPDPSVGVNWRSAACSGTTRAIHEVASQLKGEVPEGPAHGQLQSDPTGSHLRQAVESDAG